MEPKYQIGDRVRVLVNMRAGQVGTVVLVNPYGPTTTGANEYCVSFDDADANRYYVESDLAPVESEQH